jgi:hypothetical protein
MTSATRLQPEINDAEWDLILQLLDAQFAALPGEIHHTKKLAFRDELRQRFDLVQGLVVKLRPIRDRIELKSAASA